MSSLALYRTYRPGQFADVVGQEHVTVPLMRALANDRVHHAYLFSGPRGCGKTSSARILARSLNCESGPTPEPCGECQSCQDLAPNGPGNVDVIELDAATHGLVDDARDLREKAHFAPVSSRFKIYIIDEAHQLGPGAANALLKLIEEPPGHVKFIFATTAPDKIIGTIRSRTHHYPFRLIPTKVLQQNLAWICEQEGVPIEPAAVALVARAGAGSARDSQSVLGQLIAGAGDDGVTYELAVALLGFTDVALLDQVVDAVAAGDGSSVYAAVDQVMDSGHDPRRFLTDLLERFRDLVVLRAVPDAMTNGLLEIPPDQAPRMASQAAQFGPHDLIRLADVIDEGITAMKGATPTRLQLELVCARLLLPGADDSVAGIQARLDRVERRLSGGDPTAVQVSTPAASRSARGEPSSVESPIPRSAQRGSSAGSAQISAPTSSESGPAVRSEPVTESPGRRWQRSGASEDRPGGEAAVADPAAQTVAAIQPADEPVQGAMPMSPAVSANDGPAHDGPTEPGLAESAPPPASGASGPGARDAEPPGTVPVPRHGSAAGATEITPVPTGSVADVRRMWPDVLVRLKEIKRTPWSLISQESMVAEVSGGVLTLAFKQPTLRDTFARREDFQQCLRQAIKDVLLLDLKIEAIVDPSVAPTRQTDGAHAGGATPGNLAGGADNPGEDQHQRSSRRAEAVERVAQRPQVESVNRGSASGAAHAADDLDADPDDADLDDSGLSERELLERTLGATVIKEIEHD